VPSKSDEQVEEVKGLNERRNKDEISNLPDQQSFVMCCEYSSWLLKPWCYSCVTLKTGAVFWQIMGCEGISTLYRSPWVQKSSGSQRTSLENRSIHLGWSVTLESMLTWLSGWQCHMTRLPLHLGKIRFDMKIWTCSFNFLMEVENGYGIIIWK